MSRFFTLLRWRYAGLMSWLGGHRILRPKPQPWLNDTKLPPPLWWGFQRSRDGQTWESVDVETALRDLRSAWTNMDECLDLILFQKGTARTGAWIYRGRRM